MEENVIQVEPVADSQNLPEPEVESVAKKKITRHKSGSGFRKRPMRKALSSVPAQSVEQPEAIAHQSERPNRSKPTRVKFNNRNKISFDGMDPNYVYRVVNDKDGRIAKMEEIGYELVESDGQIGDYRVAEGSKMGRALSKPVGNGVTGYLMRIPKEYYDEDQAEKAKRVDSSEAALKPQKTKEEYGPGLTNE